MLIQADTRQKKKHHEIKEKFFRDAGIKVVNSKMLVGDYCIPGEKIAVDTKANITELYGNLIQDHKRFHNECVLAQECGIKLYILIENKDGIKNMKDIVNWKNPRWFQYRKMIRKCEKTGEKPPKQPASNVQLLKIMSSMNRDYGVEFLFCHPSDAGWMVIKLLEGEEG